MISSIIKEDIEKEIMSEFSQYLESLNGKTILITGGNGFIPSYLVDTFIMNNKRLKNPSKLIIINKNPSNNFSRLSHILNDENVKFIVHDVGKPFNVPEKIDIIIHAASRANPTSFLADPIDTIDANVNGVRTLLEYAKDNPVEEFLFFSTNEIYGNPLPEFIPTPETYPGNVDCTEDRACYSESKRFAETLCMTFYRKYNVPVKILRILLAYGPGMRDDGKVITDFFNKAIKEKKISFKDKGDALRSFCYISDTARAIFKVMFEGKSGEAYNIGSDLENIPIKSLAAKIAKTLNNNTVIEFNLDVLPKKIYGANNRHPDITKIRNLGFKPKINMEEGLIRFKMHKEEEKNLIIEHLNEKSKRIKRDILDLVAKRGEGHIGGAFSIADMVISLYDLILTKEDKFILSKGHAWLPLYFLLKERGLNPKLSGHPEIDRENGIECTTGSLGHGLPMGVGMALAKKIKKEPGTIYVMISDGECQEGTVWESLLLASHYKLDNLKIILDHNNLQTLGKVEDILSLENLENKFKAFNCDVLNINGHSYSEILEAFQSKTSEKPLVIIAKTIKGKGVSFMENASGWHTMVPNQDELQKAYEELK
ncbi:NAD-dependent epimerase/dehydratase family protein [Candidatus Pacearchaeota archaeon]|nr:NAD-dependent epimerase/dehydratase family protein [Candidatus Pacearchaeota archaeon]